MLTLFVTWNFNLSNSVNFYFPAYNEHSTIVAGLQEISQKTCIEFDIYDNEAEVEEKDYVCIGLLRFNYSYFSKCFF